MNFSHELKTNPIFFGLIVSGDRTADIRRNDRGYQVGDTILLREWVEEHQKYTGRELPIVITNVLHGGQYGIESGWCMLSFYLHPRQRPNPIW